MTSAQAQMLAAIKRLTVNGVSPSYAELAMECGLSSRSRVHAQLVTLEQLGFIRRAPGRARSIEAVPAAADLTPRQAAEAAFDVVRAAMKYGRPVTVEALEAAIAREVRP